MYIDQVKLEIINQTLKENQMDCWIVIASQTQIKNEPLFEVLGEIQFNDLSALIFTQNQHYLITSNEDVKMFETIVDSIKIIPYKNDFKDELFNLLNQIQPKQVALNFSKNDASCDGITLSNYHLIETVIQQLKTKPEIISSFDLIRKVRGIKTKNQLEKIEHVAKVAHQYLLQIPSILKENSTSKDIFDYLQQVATKDGYGMSWNAMQCPGVSVDPNVPAGHMGIIDTPILKGYVINIDYGVSKDGYCSDLQRMYYVLKDDEDQAPQEVVDAFNVIRDAIKLASEAMKPGVTGYQIDKIARSHVVSEGYDSWNAALGHQVGHKTHDGGTILANRRTRYNRPELIDTPLDAGNVFTIEPSLENNYGRFGIEEMVVIEKDGVRYLVEPQQEIILIRLEK